MELKKKNIKRGPGTTIFMLFFSCFIGILATAGAPLGMYALNPIVCPEEGYSFELNFRDADPTDDKRGDWYKTDTICVRDDGDFHGVPFYGYLLHFVLTTAVFFLALHIIDLLTKRSSFSDDD